MRILCICRPRGLRISTATASIILMWRQHGHVVGCDRSVGRRTTALPPFFVRTLPDPLSSRRQARISLKVENRIFLATDAVIRGVWQGILAQKCQRQKEKRKFIIAAQKLM